MRISNGPIKVESFKISGMVGLSINAVLYFGYVFNLNKGFVEKDGIVQGNGKYT